MGPPQLLHASPALRMFLVLHYHPLATRGMLIFTFLYTTLGDAKQNKISYLSIIHKWPKRIKRQILCSRILAPKGPKCILLTCIAVYRAVSGSRCSSNFHHLNEYNYESGKTKVNCHWESWASDVSKWTCMLEKSKARSLLPHMHYWRFYSHHACAI